MALLRQSKESWHCVTARPCAKFANKNAIALLSHVKYSGPSMASIGYVALTKTLWHFKVNQETDDRLCHLTSRLREVSKKVKTFRKQKQKWKKTKLIKQIQNQKRKQKWKWKSQNKSKNENENKNEKSKNQKNENEKQN